MTTDGEEGPSKKQQQLMSLITEAFRGASTQPEREPGLFQWRHLEVMEKIGEGGFGEVYRAYDSQLRRDVALKLNRGSDTDRLAREGVMAEARRMARLRHPNILAVHGADEADGRMGIWFDLLHGETLEQRCETQTRLEPSEVLALALPIASALSLIHTRRLVHGDVKPANIMVLDDGAPMLMDFGAATEPLRPQLQTAGSPLLMAPEQFSGASASPASDVYAFGATLYRLLTGRYPLTADSFDELADLHDSATRPELTDLPRAWRPLLARQLDQDPANRPSAAQIESRLRFIAEAPQRRRRRAALSTVIGSLIIATTVAVIAARVQSQSQQRTEAVKNTLVEAIQTVSPMRSSSPGTIQNLYQNLLSLAETRLEQFPRGQADMMLSAAEALAGFGDTEKAIAGAKRGVELLEAQPDTSPHSLATAYNMLATAYNQAEDYSASLAISQKTLAVLEGQDFKTAPELTLVAHNKIYFALDGLGRWREALSAQRALLSARKDLYGEDSMRMAVDHHNLATTLINVGDYAEAVGHSQRAVEILRANGHAESARMGIALGALGRGQLSQGDLAAAAETQARAHALLESFFGPDHRRVLGLEILKARIDIARGEKDPSINRLKELENAEALTELDRFQLRRVLADAAADNLQWAEAIAYWDRALAELPDAERPIRQVLVSARAYAAFRAGMTETSPLPELSGALAALTDQGLDSVWGTERLRSWVGTLP
ncbi:MAG: serine/threonine-protein kinase [Pseudomonadota bacterium]